MNYWITTHWPPRADNSKREPSGVWLPDGRQQAGVQLHADDPVLIYESRSGRTELREKADGSTYAVKSVRGKEGIVAVTRALEGIHRNPDTTVTRYVDGTEICWCWQAATELLSSNGFVQRAELNRVLGYKPSYNLRGFGDRKSGLKRISKEEYETLVAIFKRRAGRSDLVTRALRKKHSPRVRGTGGESPEHKHLKERVAADPSAVLGEAGLRTVKVESSFPTGDRADIVLEDSLGRIIGVEIELRVGDLDLPGVLQALKYRAMLELTHEQKHGQGRAFLVAHSISPGIRDLCTQYRVECFVVS
ncbi:MAG: hypothetical protein FJ224_02255 [Lentisphaerae bacterium]|nr:hypothetical protein [Lentisphaerota bacterium]